MTYHRYFNWPSTNEFYQTSHRGKLNSRQCFPIRVLKIVFHFVTGQSFRAKYEFVKRSWTIKYIQYINILLGVNDHASTMIGYLVVVNFYIS